MTVWPGLIVAVPRIQRDPIRLCGELFELDEAQILPPEAFLRWEQTQEVEPELYLREFMELELSSPEALLEFQKTHGWIVQAEDVSTLLPEDFLSLDGMVLAPMRELQECVRPHLLDDEARRARMGFWSKEDDQHLDRAEPEGGQAWGRAPRPDRSPWGGSLDGKVIDEQSYADKLYHRPFVHTRETVFCAQVLRNVTRTVLALRGSLTLGDLRTQWEGPSAWPYRPDSPSDSGDTMSDEEREDYLNYVEMVLNAAFPPSTCRSRGGSRRRCLASVPAAFTRSTRHSVRLPNHIAEHASYHRCANETCGRLFVRQRGGSEIGLKRGLEHGKYPHQRRPLLHAAVCSGAGGKDAAPTQARGGGSRQD